MLTGAVEGARLGMLELDWVGASDGTILAESEKSIAGARRRACILEMLESNRDTTIRVENGLRTFILIFFLFLLPFAVSSNKLMFEPCVQFLVL